VYPGTFSLIVEFFFFFFFFSASTLDGQRLPTDGHFASDLRGARAHFRLVSDAWITTAFPIDLDLKRLLSSEVWRRLRRNFATIGASLRAIHAWVGRCWGIALMMGIF